MKIDQEGIDRIKNRKMKEFEILQRTGTLCTIEKSKQIENCMILGKVAKINNIKRKSRNQATDILVIWLKEALQYKKLSSKARKIFRAIFVDDIAIQLYKVKFDIDDTIAIHQALVNGYTGSKQGEELHDLQVSLGLFKPAELKQVFFKRKNTSSWINLSEWSSKQVSIEPQVPSSSNKQLMTSGIQNPANVLPSKGSSKSKAVSYEFLKDLDSPKITNVFAIVRSVMKRVSKTQKGHYHSMIKIIDETNLLGFRVHVYYNDVNKPPFMDVNSVVRLHRLKIEKLGTTFDGRVFNSWDIVMFDAKCPLMYYTTSKKTTVTEENNKRVQELLNWFELSDITSPSSPFTKLEELHLITRKFDFKGKILSTKLFAENNILVLRVHDGTSCPYPCYLFDFSTDRWKDLKEHNNGVNKNSRCMDIIICDPADIYRHLKEGMDLVLKNILSFAPQFVVENEIIKEIRLYGDGSSESLILSL